MQFSSLIIALSAVVAVCAAPQATTPDQTEQCLNDCFNTVLDIPEFTALFQCTSSAVGAEAQAQCICKAPAASLSKIQTCLQTSCAVVARQFQTDCATLLAGIAEQESAPAAPPAAPAAPPAAPAPPPATNATPQPPAGQQVPQGTAPDPYSATQDSYDTSQGSYGTPPAPSDKSQDTPATPDTKKSAKVGNAAVGRSSSSGIAALTAFAAVGVLFL